MQKESYNIKVKEFPNGTKITHYTNSIRRGYKRPKENESEIDENEKCQCQQRERTEKEIKRSAAVSLNRSKNKIYDLARANKWDYFITLTFDPKKTDNTSFEVVSSCFSKFVDCVKHTKSLRLKYLFVPELHSDGAKYHLHGLVSDIGIMKLSETNLTDNDGYRIYTVSDWNYGYSSATQIKDTARASAYITKYITKDLFIKTKNKRRYFASRNLEKPVETFHKSALLLEDIINAYNPDYIKSITVPQAYNRITHMEIDD